MTALAFALVGVLFGATHAAEVGGALDSAVAAAFAKFKAEHNRV
jgi:hypothetical protein